jgi:DUF4097 and DUF4098 domain-containing protein YvlB
MRFVCALLTIVAAAGFAQAQLRDNQEKQLSCNGSTRNINGNGGAHACEIRETTLGPSGSLDVEPGHNGGITVKGWSQNNVLVRAQVETWASTDANARGVATQVRVDAGGGQIRATGPDSNSTTGNWNEGWAVSFEIFAPWNTNLKLESHNGSISISDMRGRIELQSHNGSVHLARVSGDVTGETHNGEIQAELSGNSWDGRQLELKTYNGSVTLSMTSSFSASVETSSFRGGVSSDFPINVTGRIDAGDMRFNLGSGGPPIKVSTHNGGIRLRRM